MAQKIYPPTKDEKSELYELAGLGREHGLDAEIAAPWREPWGWLK